MQTIFNLIPKLNIIYFKWISNNANQYFINIIFPATCTVVMNPINIKATYTQMLPAPSVRRSKIVFQGECVVQYMYTTGHVIHSASFIILCLQYKNIFSKGRQSNGDVEKDYKRIQTLICIYNHVYTVYFSLVVFIFVF